MRIMRQYMRSQIPRLRWTGELHQSFLHAIRCLGDENKATPKLIMEVMGINGLRTSHVKSHLQMYRNMKKYENRQVPKHGNSNLDKIESRRKRSRDKDGNVTGSNLVQKLKNNSLPFSHKRLRACEVQSSLIDELPLEHATSSHQSPSYGDYNRKCSKNPKLNAAENGMEHLLEYIYRPLQCNQKKGEQDILIPFKVQLEDSLYHQHEIFSSSSTSNLNRKPVSEEYEISYSTSNDSQPIHTNSKQFDNYWRAKSKEQDVVKFDKKPRFREDDVQLELSLSIS